MRLGFTTFNQNPSYTVSRGKNPSFQRPKTLRQPPTAKKVMTSVFWNSEVVFMIDYLQKGQTITE
jgi:hypothetical protein